MKIRPKIPIYLMGNIITAPLWYINRYGGRTALLGWDKSKRYNYANLSLMLNDHLNAGDLNTAYTKNKFYTDNPGAVSADILSFYDSDGKGMTAELFVKYYNDRAGEIRSHWAQDLTYGKATAETHNLLYQRMFKGRSNSDLTKGSDYNIGYLPDLEKIEGSSTWLRRMDLYENKFDLNNPDPNRVHEIKLSDGTTAKVYKTENGNIELLPLTLNAPPSASTDPSKNPLKLENPQKQNDQTLENRLRSQLTEDPPEKESFLNKINQGFNKIAPDLLEGLRLAGSLYTNGRVFKESEKAIIPNLLLTYQTHRLIVGDEATKQAYYRRAVLGETKAALPFTSDADRLIAYMMDAKRVGDELRAQGDLADNAEIRRTSDESNQHEWANTQRATEVANANITEMNKAEAAKHQLRALKYLADWTNIDLFLLGRLAKIDLKRNKDLAYLQLLLLLEDLHEIASDETLLRLKAEASAAYDSYANDTTNLAKYNNYKAKMKAYEDHKYNLEKRILTRRAAQSAKSGAKLEYKDKTAKFLYKTSKDIVEHFRRMSKMTDDSRVKTLPKPIKLSSHPKKKLLMGGVAPFYVYRPYISGMELSMSSLVSSSGTSSSSKKDNEGKDKLDMIKELFKSVYQSQGLPIDVSTVYLDVSKVLNKAKAFGEDLSTDDIASMYLNSMLKLNNIRHSKEVFDKARTQATTNGALNEYAVTAEGALVLLNREGEIKFGTYLDYVDSKGKWNPITNDQLLNLRAYSPNMALFKGDELMQIVNNGVGMPKIAAEIKSLAYTLGSNELKIEGISEVERGKIKNGLSILAGTAGTPDGFYKVTHDKKDQSANVQIALNYIYSMLPNNYKTVLKMHSGSEDNSKALIASMLTSQINNHYEEDIAPLTGKAASKNGNSTGGENDMSTSMAFFNGMGEKGTFIILDKTSDGLKVNTISTTITSNGKNTGTITFDKLESSDFGGQLLMNQATMGDNLISPIGRNNIIIDGRIYLTELPIDKVAKSLGIIKPDLKFLKKIEIADLKLKSMGIDKNDPANIPIVNKIYQENELPILYTISDNKPILTSDYARFAIVNGIGTEDAFGENPELNNSMVKEISDEKERLLFEILMLQSSNSKYKLDNGYGIGPLSWGETKLYLGTIYIPMATSNISALSGTGYKAKGSEYNEIEAQQLEADAARLKGFNPAGNTL